MPLQPPPATLAHRALPDWQPLAAGALAAASFVCMDVAIKSLSTHYGALQLAFLRFASGSLYAVALWLWQRSPMPPRAAWRMHGLRAVLLLVSLVSYFHALSLLPLVQAAGMSYLAPIFVSLLAVWWLKERPSNWLWAALALGFAGVVVALGPALLGSLRGAGMSVGAGGAGGAGGTGGNQLVGLASAALGAVAFALVMLLARQQAQRESLWTILLLQNLLPTALLALPAYTIWRPLQPADIGTVLLAGLFATVGLVSLTWSFKHLQASRVAPLEYTGVVWAAGLGYAVFGEVPTGATVLSAALIVAGCLLLLRR